MTNCVRCLNAYPVGVHHVCPDAKPERCDCAQVCGDDARLKGEPNAGQLTCARKTVIRGPWVTQ